MTRTPEYDAATAWARVESAYEKARTHPEYYSEFADAVRRIDWDTASVEIFREAVDMALSLGAVKFAREVANLGLEHYPDDQRLTRAAHVLAPAKMVRTLPASGEGLASTMAWIKENAARYRGLWIAIEAGQLIGSASSRQELVRQLGDSASMGMLITRIP